MRVTCKNRELEAKLVTISARACGEPGDRQGPCHVSLRENDKPTGRWAWLTAGLDSFGFGCWARLLKLGFAAIGPAWQWALQLLGPTNDLGFGPTYGLTLGLT